MEFVKKIGALELELKQKDNQYESLCRERYVLQRDLQQTKEVVLDLKSKYKEIIQTLELIRDDTKKKSMQLEKEIAKKEKAEKEVENLKEKFQKIQENLQYNKTNMEMEQKKEFKLRKMISEKDNENMVLKKVVEQLRRELDVFKNELFLKNDEISFLHKNINELENMIVKNKTQNNKKVEEIHIMQTELKNLREEKIELVKAVYESKYLKKKICNLEEDLLQEKVKNKTVEEELTNPLNFHRWRKQAAEPESYELIQKIQFLQKRSLKMAEDGIEQKEQLKEARELNSNLQRKIEKLSLKEFHLQLYDLRNCLHQQKRKNKALEADIQMYKSQALDYKSTIEMKNEEINCAMRKELCKKKKKIFAAKVKEINTFLSGLSSIQTRKRHFKGGGFRLSNSSPI